MAIRLNDELSGLFFNHWHENWDEAHPPRKEGVRYVPTSQEQKEEAIRRDAAQFIEDYQRTCAFLGPVTAEELAEDFFHRL